MNGTLIYRGRKFEVFQGYVLEVTRPASRQGRLLLVRNEDGDEVYAQTNLDAREQDRVWLLGTRERDRFVVVRAGLNTLAATFDEPIPMELAASPAERFLNTILVPLISLLAVIGAAQLAAAHFLSGTWLVAAFAAVIYLGSVHPTRRFQRFREQALPSR
ncbi:MAG TPA: hypothetical protein VFA75_00460 [Nevskia sp.]|nr:hypothetical protein [Nevskia sp.]